MLSGIPQGSVLGPCLFVTFINSLPEVVENSEVYLFADDTKIYKEIYNETDCDLLQNDLNNLVEWTDESLLKFHPDKCVSMRIGKSKTANREYTIGTDNHKLKQVQEEKDIGVIIDSQLSFQNT